MKFDLTQLIRPPC